MTMLRTINEETSVEDRASSSTLPSKESTETVLDRHSSLPSYSSQHVKERLEIEDSDSDWDDEASGGNSIGNNKTSSQSLPFNDRFRQQNEFQVPASQKSNFIGHQTFLERLGRILCNHSAAVDTCDDTSVIVEISGPATVSRGDGDSVEKNDSNNALNPQNHCDESHVSSEDRKRLAIQRSQEEHLLQVIMSQKRQLDKLW